MTKVCPRATYTGQPGSYCTITSSNVEPIEVGSRIIYARPDLVPTSGSEVVLDLPGPGNNKAFGRCALSPPTFFGQCTFAGGTGKFTHFHATVAVSHDQSFSLWFWDGTYSFSPQD